MSVASVLSLGLLGGCAASAEDVDETAGETTDALRTPKLLCASRADAPIYFGDESQILLTADIDGERSLKKLSLTMREDDKLGVRNENLTAQANYRPRNPLYTDHQKFNAADAWCGYSIIAPKGLARRTASFPVYVQEACEGGFVATATLNCRVQNGVSTPTPGGTLAASVVLKYDAARKRELIDGRHFKAPDFTGNDIVVSDASTDIDIDRLLPHSDETAPNAMCYRGTVSDAKKILTAMLLNTDGNGDHWLDAGYRLTTERASSAIKVSFTVIGEGGPEDFELAVPKCP